MTAPWTRERVLEHPVLGPVLVRPLGPGDVAYCARSWLATHRDCPEGRLIRDDARYHALHGPLVRGMLVDPDLVRLAMCPEDDPATILAFVIAEPPRGGDDLPVLHYLHVRGVCRGQGLAIQLAEEVGVRPGEPFAVTYATRDLMRLPPRWLRSHRPDLLERTR